MHRKLFQRGECRLEGLCESTVDDVYGAGNRIRIGRGSTGMERLEARFVEFKRAYGLTPAKWAAALV